jgi:histidyl-tRNA synthetase
VSPFVPSQIVRHLTDSLQHQLSLYGYELIETPIIESADLFLTRAGDQLINRLFTFDRFGQQLALRPEFTAAAAHRYARMAAPEVVRWQFGGPVFEDAPGSRAYQHFSIGAELIGMNGALADAEIISLAAQGIITQGLQDWNLVIGHTGLMRHLLSLFDLDRRTERFLLNHLVNLQDPDAGKAFVLEEFDRILTGASFPIDQITSFGHDPQALDVTEISTRQMLNVLLDATQRGMTMGGRTRHDIARRLLNKHQRFVERHQVVEALDLLEQWVAIRAPVEEAFAAIEKLLPANDQAGSRILSGWRESVSLLASYEIPLHRVVIQPHVARNWDYYTGIVFEISANNSTQLAGGGRYDELVSLVGGQSVPAVGFAYYIDQMTAFLQQHTPNIVEPVLIEVDPDNQKAASHLAHRLRGRDVPVILLYNSTSGKHRLRITPDGQVQINGKIYASSDLDALIADLSAGNV